MIEPEQMTFKYILQNLNGKHTVEISAQTGSYYCKNARNILSEKKRFCIV